MCIGVTVFSDTIPDVPERGTRKGAFYMKHTNSVFKKALSVFLCAIMMLSVVSVGIIMPETKITSYAATANSYDTLKSAIETANSAGGTTTITLSGDINDTNSRAALPAITGKVILDLAGKNITFQLTKSTSTGFLDPKDTNQNHKEIQLPLENQGSDRSPDDVLTKAMLNVASGGSLQIINSSSTASTAFCNTQITRDTFGGTDRYTYVTSSHLIYSEGTLIIGDRTNYSNNNFTLKTKSIVYANDSTSDYHPINAYTYSVPITVNGSNAQFYMYGATVNAIASSRGKYNGNLRAGCYGLLINNCAVAEIYGGTINIPYVDECGLRCTSNTNTDGCDAYFNSIRVKGGNVYIFNVTADIAPNAGADTNCSGATYVPATICNSGSNTYVYGATLSNSSAHSDQDALNPTLHTIYGSVKGAQEETAGGTSYSLPGNKTIAANTATSLTVTTLFYFADTLTENGTYPWGDGTGTYKAYLDSNAYKTDAYRYQIKTETSSLAAVTTRDYLRNGYYHNGWLYTRIPGEAGTSTALTTGGVFCYPVWTPTVYTITYNLNDETGNNRASNPSAVDTYTITSTSALPTPVRAGYTFGGWLLDSKSVPATDTVTDAWMQGSTYPAGTSLTGKNGNITLKALWTEVPYTATFDWDNIPAGASGDKTVTTASYDVNSFFNFPTGCTKDYYTFNNTWKVTTAAGGFTAGNTYGAGNTSDNASYGDVTFTAQYTPINYYVTFDPNGGTAISPNYDTTDANKYIYNYESTATLPSTTRLGYTFTGWKPTAIVDGLWDPSTNYPAGTSLNHMHGSVTLVAQWSSVASTVTLTLGEGEVISGNTTLPYAYSSSLTLNNPTKTGYQFIGWKVSVAPTDYTSDIPAENRWSAGTEYLLGSEQNVTIPANMIGDVTLVPIWAPVNYTVTFNSNGGSECASKNYNITGSVTLPIPVRNGYSFSGWSVTAHGDVYNWTDSAYAGGTTVSGKYGSVTLTANWTVSSYTVTLDVNGGNALASSTLAYKTDNNTSLPVATRTGYDFAGWKLSSCDSGSDWNSYVGRPENDIYTNALPLGHYGNLTLKAQWTPHQYTVTLISSGSNGGTINYTIESPAFNLGASASSGYDFTGWKVTLANGSWTKDNVYTAAQNISNMYGDVTLTAQFAPKTYYITYFSDESGTVQYGDAVPYSIAESFTLNTYSANGYTFDGWKVKSVADGGGWTADSVMPAGEYDSGFYYGDVELVPSLSLVNYTISFDSDGGTLIPNKTYNITTDDYTLPTPEKTGYDFAGWKVTSADGSWAADSVITAGTSVEGKYGTVTLTAQWTAKKYDITYIVGDTTLYSDGITKEGTYNEQAPDLTAEEKAKPSDAQYDYTFDHWSPALATVTGETTYTAVYTNTLRSYDINWMLPADVSGTPGNYTSDHISNVNYGVVPSFGEVNPVLASADSAEYSWRFTGWSTTAGGAVLSALPAVSGTATYYAIFAKVLAPEEVHWIINGVDNVELWGIGETPSWQHDTPTKPDEDGYKYTFSNWDSTPVPVVKGNTYTYTAVFSSELQTYDYALDVNGGETEAELEGTYKMGDIISFPAPSKTGYTFSGWKLDSAVGTWISETVVNAGDYTTNTLWGDVSFTAQWTPVDYTITYNPSASDDVVPAAQTYNIESTAALGEAEKTGYSLAGWVVSTGSGTWTNGMNLSADYVLNNDWGNVTLTPIWQVNTYTITWNSDGVIQTSEVEYGSAILAIPPAAKMGYTAEWDNDVPAAMPANDLTFNAVYTPVEYYIKLNVNGGSAVENFYYTIDGNHTLPTPTRDGATFTGWKVTAAAGNWVKNSVLEGGKSLNGKYGSVSLTAQWKLRTCTVIWNAGDVVKTTEWYYGATPSFDGTPYKSPDEYNSYVFSGWDKEITPVTEDEVTYNALFDATERIYTVTWNIDSVETTEQYKYGETPVYKGSTPARNSTAEYDFTFSGWSPEISEVTKDVTYTAQFDVFTKLLGLSLDLSSKFIDLESSFTLNANIYPSTASVRDVIWTSLNPDIATIDATGKVTAQSAGISIVKVSSVDGKFASYCVVTVNPRISNYVSVTAGGVSTTQLPGTSIQLTATLQPENVSANGLVWSSSNNAVAEVDQNGLVTYKTAGKAIITAKAKDGYASGTIEVVGASSESDVVELEKTYLVSFAAAGTKFIVGGEQYQTLQVKCKDGQVLRFGIANPEYFFVNANGSVILMDSDGMCSITVDRNLAIITEPLPIGTDVIDPHKDENDAPSFWARVQAFFRKIVEFFRNLFK